MISDPMLLPAVGFALTVPIYVLVALLFGIYIPELFPTEVRLRASGIVNTLGRGATIVTPFLVVMLFEARGVAGVMALMIGLLVVQIVTVWRSASSPPGGASKRSPDAGTIASAGDPAPSFAGGRFPMCELAR